MNPADEPNPFDRGFNGDPRLYDPNPPRWSQDPEPPKPRPLQAAFITEDELESLTIPEPVPIVEGLLCAGDMAMMGGQSKSMKSWWSQHLAICVTYGLHFMGRRCTRGNVLYVNLELKPHTIRYRTRAIKSAKAICVPSISTLTFLNLRHTKATALMLRNAINEHIEKADHRFSLIVIDPFYMLAQGVDENAAGEMSQLLGEIAGISLDTGAAILMPAHFAKGNASAKESIDRISGSGVIARNMDAIFTLTRLVEEKTFVFEATVRALPPVDPIALRWEAPVFTTDDTLDPSNLLLPKKFGRPPKATDLQVLDLLEDTGMERDDWKTTAMQILLIGKTVAADHIKSLIQDGRAIQAKAPGGGKRWYPSKETVDERRERAQKEALRNAPK